MKKNKIAFIFLDKTYLIYHSLPLAIELAKNIHNEVFILAVKRNKTVVEKILQERKTTNITIIELRPYWRFALTHFLELKLQLRRVLFHKYRRLLRSMDAIICTQFSDLLLNKKISSSTKLVYTTHGAGSGPYAFKNDVLDFDLFFIAGIRDLELRKNLNQLKKGNYCMTGYLKFDFLAHSETLNFFNNDNTTLVYNPHWRKELSSIYKYGAQILDFFVRNPNYNLIVAPHSFIVEKSLSVLNLLDKYKKYTNIKIDYSSENLNNMSYLRSSSIYIGDVSSQALEFVYIKPRPCLFIDAHNLSATGDFVFTKLGTVVENADAFENSINKAKLDFKNRFKEKQETLISNMFYTSDLSPSQIASEAIIDLINNK